jgi:hypothetical protein
MLARGDAQTVLDLWECALGVPPIARADALLRAVGVLEDCRTLGERNCRLVELHSRLFGCDIALSSRCPTCDLPVEFSSHGEALASRMRPRITDASPLRFENQGHAIEFRLPCSDDIASIDDEDDEAFVQRLIERCVTACARNDTHVPVRELPATVLDALSQHMEALDPGATICFALACPQCGGQWQSRLDVGELVWKKVRVAAEQTLLDIDALARTYGWTEREVLRLSPLRRAAYLQMVLA